MGPLMVSVCLLAALCASLCSASPVSDILGVLVRSPASVRRGHTTTLPCWLNPPQNAVGLEVRWYRPSHFDSPVMLYRAKVFEDASQDTSYKGRVSFGLKDAASGGLAAGDVSLKLVNVTIEDAGDYTCYVSSDQGYDSASVSLAVSETGAPLLLSAVWTETDKDKVANVSCESEGWYPKPGLRWSDQQRVLTPKGLKFSKGPSGLLTVHSWLLVSSSSEVSCSVGLPGEEAKEARVRLGNPPQPESGSAGWVAFAILLIAVLAGAGAGVFYFKKRRKEKKAKSGSDDIEESPLLPKVVIQPTDPSTAQQCYVNVTPETMDHPYLVIKGSKLRDKCGDLPDGHAVTSLTAVRGMRGFSSGQHYWEVSLGNTRVGLKQSWWVGVTNATHIPQVTDFTSTNCNGYWFLSSSPDRANIFQLSTEPKVLLPVYSRPQTVGVYLNYDGGELSFYNVEDKCLIGSLAATFKGAVFPFFNPGKGDTAPMEILHRPEQCSGVGNSAEQTAPEMKS